MEKNIRMAFVFSLITLILLNFLFYIIGFSIEGLLDYEMNDIATNPIWILYRLFQPFGHFPFDLAGLIEAPVLGHLLRYIGMIITLIITALVAGMAGGNNKNAIKGWVLTCIVCIVMVGIAASLIYEVRIRVTLNTSSEIIIAIVFVIMAGAVNILIFGVITILVAYYIRK